MAAIQFLKNQVKKSPLVQAVQQKSLKPYRQALSTALEPGNLMPMGKAKTLKMPSPQVMQKSIFEAENDMAQRKAMLHLDQAQMTADRIKQYTQNKFQQGFKRAHNGQQDATKLLASYIFRKQ